jgi:hypothetical protein
MKIKTTFGWLVLTVWFFSLVACGLPFEAARPTAATQAISAPASTAALPPTATLVPPTATPIPPTPSPAPTFTPTARPVDMSKAKLLLTDFPAGFQELDAAAQARLGMSAESLSKPFEGIFRQASPVTTFAFANPEPKSFEVVIGLVFYPLTPPEQAAFDHMLADPTATMRDFSQGFGGQAQLVAELGTFGDASIGWTFTTTSGQSKFKGEMVLLRRAGAVGLLLTMFQADQKPPAPASLLAPLLDKRIQQGLGR